MPLRVKQPFVEKNTYYQHFAWWTTTTGFSKLSIYITLDKFFLRQMDAVVSVNLLMPNIGGKAEKYFVENGIPPLSFDVASIASTDPEVYNFCKKGFIIGVISRLSEEKGLSYSTPSD